MDFEAENTTDPTPRSSNDEGRAHFLETLGAGEDALNSLKQLRELNTQNNQGVILSSTPEELSLPGSQDVNPSRSINIQLPAGHRISTGGNAPAESEKPAEEKKEVKPAGGSESSPGKSVKESEPASELQDLPLFSYAPGAEEQTRTEEPVEESNTPEPSDVDLDEAEVSAVSEIEKMAPVTEIAPGGCGEQEPEPPAKEETPENSADEAAISTLQADEPQRQDPEVTEETANNRADPESLEEEPSSLESDSSSTSSKTEPETISEPSAASEQLTLQCPKCQGELILMREHLGIEGSCVWCQTPIVAAASGGNGDVRIFPILTQPGVFAPPAAAVAADNQEASPETSSSDDTAKNDLVAETGDLNVTDLEQPSVDLEQENQETSSEPVTQDEVPVKELISQKPSHGWQETANSQEEEAPEADFAVVPKADETSAEAVTAPEAIPSGFALPEMDAAEVSEEKPGPLEPQSEGSEITSPGEGPDLDALPAFPTGFQNPAPESTASPEAPTEDVNAPPAEVIPSGFDPAPVAPENEIPSGFDSFAPPVEDPAAAPGELGPEEAMPASEFAGLPAPEPGTDLPSGFSSGTADSDDEPESLSSEAPESGAAEAATPETVEESQDPVASGFNTPEPWGAPSVEPSPKSENPDIEADMTDEIPSGFGLPAEADAAVTPFEEVESHSNDPAPAAPLDPDSTVNSGSPFGLEEESNEVSSSFVERDTETVAAAAAGFGSEGGLDDAPQEIEQEAGDAAEGFSGFAIPENKKATNDFGPLEMSAPSDESSLPAPESDSADETAGVESWAAPAENTEETPSTPPGMGISLLAGSDDEERRASFGNSPFASLTKEAPEETAEEEPPGTVDEAVVEEGEKLPPPIQEESAPLNKTPEPEAPRVESKPLGSLSSKKKPRKGFIIFMVILVGFVCGGALATFVLPVEEYVATARSYMEAKFSLPSGQETGSFPLPSALSNDGEAPPITPEN